MTLLQDIENAKHVVIKFDVDFLTSACALYTYALQQHKKVSLLCEDKEIDTRLSFLPWFEKIKTSGYSSADLVVELKITAIDLYELFKENSIKINQKMATALYAGLLIQTDGFKNTTTNGMSFAMAKELIDSKAEYKICTNFILNTKSLAYLRLKSIMLKNMILTDDAKNVLVNIDDEDLKSSGAKLEDAYEILKDTLTLAHVKESVLVKNAKILKRLQKEI